MDNNVKMTWQSWWNEIETKALEDPRGKAISACGFGVWHTGGGCKAWGLNIPGGSHIMLTDMDAGLFRDPELADDCWMIGSYDADGEELTECMEARDLYDALTMAMTEALRLSSATLDPEHCDWLLKYCQIINGIKTMPQELRRA